MTTFEAISYIREQSLSRSEALRFLIERLSFSTAYADDIIAIVLPETILPRESADPMTNRDTS